MCQSCVIRMHMVGSVRLCSKFRFIDVSGPTWRTPSWRRANLDTWNAASFLLETRPWRWNGSSMENPSILRTDSGGREKLHLFIYRWKCAALTLTCLIICLLSWFIVDSQFEWMDFSSLHNGRFLLIFSGWLMTLDTSLWICFMFILRTLASTNASPPMLMDRLSPPALSLATSHPGKWE